MIAACIPEPKEMEYGPRHFVISRTLTGYFVYAIAAAVFGVKPCLLNLEASWQNEARDGGCVPVVG